MINAAAYVEAQRVVDKLNAMPKADKKWAHVAPPKRGDETADDVLRAVGRALSAWEQFETQLSGFFLFLISSPNNDAAERAFGYIGSPTGKFNALKGAFEVMAQTHDVSADDVKRFKALQTHFALAAHRRNDIAHGIVTSVNVQDVDQGYFLVPAMHDSTKNKVRAIDWAFDAEDPYQGWGWAFRFTAASVDHYAAQFGELWSAVQDFQYYLEVKWHPKN